MVQNSRSPHFFAVANAHKIFLIGHIGSMDSLGSTCIRNIMLTYGRGFKSNPLEYNNEGRGLATKKKSTNSKPRVIKELIEYWGIDPLILVNYTSKNNARGEKRDDMRRWQS